MPEGPVFPERMRANKALAGRICPGCSSAIEVAQPVWNCRACGGTMHEACHRTAQGCLQEGCPTLAPRAPSPEASGAAAGAPAAATKRCPHCGEQILKAAQKCRFCGEYLAPGLKSLETLGKQEEDDKLTSGEVLFGVLCGGLACIMALVWLVQGKKKGWKLLLIALVSQVVIAMIQAAAKK